jgi:single-stranded-DNA-specific exonuclease
LTTRIIQRKHDQNLARAIELSLPDHINNKQWLAERISARIEGEDLQSAIKGIAPSLANIADPVGIPDMSVAVERISRAVTSGEHIAIACDHDADGSTSAAVFYRAIVEIFGVEPSRITVHTSHRVREGYGLCDEVVDRILATQASLVITGDKGSSDQDRIARLAGEGVDTVVTDHHAIPVEGPPESAIACVNPAREDSQYDPTIAGVAVAWLTMAKVRTRLNQLGALPGNAPSLSTLLDLVAVGVTADCVSLNPTAHPNRAFVRAGLALMNKPGHRAVWDVARERIEGPITETTIGFRIAPMIAAGGRLDWATHGIDLMCCNDKHQSRRLWDELERFNEDRKAIQKAMVEKAEQAIVGKDHCPAHVIYLEDGHSGVHGIVASRISEATGKPCVMLSPKGGRDKNQAPIEEKQGEKLLSGSLRAGQSHLIHLRDALQSIEDTQPGLLKRFGGHKAAAGITIDQADVERFQAAFNKAIEDQTQGEKLAPTFYVDGPMPGSDPFLVEQDLNALAPWGRKFDPLVFHDRARIQSIRELGDGTHLRMQVRLDSGVELTAVWFNAKNSFDAAPVRIGQVISMVYSLSPNYWKGQVSMQAMIKTIDQDGEIKEYAA